MLKIRSSAWLWTSANIDFPDAISHLSNSRVAYLRAGYRPLLETYTLRYKNALKLKPVDMQAQMKAGAAFLGENLPPLQNNIVPYPRQFIAVVVAETYQQARTALYKLKVRYVVEKAAVDLKTEQQKIKDVNG